MPRRGGQVSSRADNVVAANGDVAWGSANCRRRLAASGVRVDVLLRIRVHRTHAGDVRGFESSEGDGEVMTRLQGGVATKVRQALALLLGHVVTVRLVSRSNGLIPALATHYMVSDALHRVADVVVVLDRVLGLLGRRVDATAAPAEMQQRGIEQPLLSRSVHLKEGRQTAPYRGQAGGVGALKLLKNGEQSALLVMVIKDQLGDIHKDERNCQR